MFARTNHAYNFILDKCSQIHDNHFPMVLQRLENLKLLTINDWIGIAERTLEILGKHCKNLTVLELNREFAFIQTTDALHLIHLVNLQILKVTFKPKISGDFLANLVERYQQLVSLYITDLSGCPDITEIIFEVAKDACDTRSNNVMLKMIVRGTSIDKQKILDEDKLSPFLQIVNIDLYVINIDTSGIGFIFPDNDFNWSHVY